MSKSTDNHSQWLLADRALTPIISSVPLPTTSTTGDDDLSRNEQKRLQSLTTVTTTAVSVFDSAARLGLGLPQRVVVETKAGGPVVLHAFLNPPSRRNKGKTIDRENDERGILEQARDDLRPLTATTDGGSVNHQEVGESSVNGVTGSGQSGEDQEEEDDEEESEGSSQQSPLLIASVIASSLGEARKAIGGLERTGREIQKALILERAQEESQDVLEGGSDG